MHFSVQQTDAKPIGMDVAKQRLDGAGTEATGYCLDYLIRWKVLFVSDLLLLV